jgi:hypothetical protein
MWAELKKYREEYLKLKLDENINYSTSTHGEMVTEGFHV